MKHISNHLGSILLSATFALTSVFSPPVEQDQEQKHNLNKHIFSDRPIGYVALDLEKKHLKDITEEHYQNLDTIIEKAGNSLKKSILYPESTRIKKLHNDLGYQYKETVRFSDILKKEKNSYFSDCDTLSFLFKTIGKVYDIPMSLVHAPGHIFISMNKNYAEFYETTTNKFLTEEDYVRTFDIPTSLIEKGIYLNELSREEDISFIYNYIGLELIKREKYDDAFAVFSEAVELNPDEPDFHCNLGNVLTKQDRIEEALRHYENSININPRDDLYQQNKGFALTKIGDFEGAAEAYETAINVEPENLDYHANKLNALRRLWNF